MKLNSIQFLRAMAAIFVVYEHSLALQIRYAVSWQQNFFYLKNFGCIGVDLFFVISGFIISYVANQYIGIEQAFHFLKKRFWRINPIYYIYTLLFLGVVLLNIWITHINLNLYIIKIISSLFDTLLMLPTTDNAYSFSPLLFVGWTLSFEWLFYILFFGLILCKVKNKTFYLIGAIASLTIIGQIIRPSDFRLTFLTNPIMLEFLLGVILCWWYLRGKSISMYLAISLLVLGLACYFTLIMIGHGNVYHFMGVLGGELSLSRFFHWGIPSSCIVAGCVFLEKNQRLNRLWNNKWIQKIGDSSYSIYLVHLVVFKLFDTLYKLVGLFLPADALIWLQVIVAILFSISLYKLVEKPILQATRYIFF
jgi:exopolysaccharide production protein ExoZ